MSRTPARWVTASVVAGSLALLGSSCRPVAQERLDDAGEADYEFVGDDRGIELPGDFPAELPLHPDALPVSMVRTGETGMHVMFRVASPVEDVQAWYVERLRAKGWNVPVNSTSDDGRMVVAERADLSVTLMLTADEAGRTKLTVLHERLQEGRGR